MGILLFYKHGILKFYLYDYRILWLKYYYVRLNKGIHQLIVKTFLFLYNIIAQIKYKPTQEETQYNIIPI